MTTRNPHWGTTLDDFLTEEGLCESAKAEAATRVLAWQLGEEMERQGRGLVGCLPAAGDGGRSASD